MRDEIGFLRSALQDRYAVRRELGHGGSARVYLCDDLRYDRPVALKLLRADAAATASPERFLREISITARLNHPHILPLLDADDIEGRVYYVMPYVEGETLSARLREGGALDLAEAIALVKDVAGALSYAHAEGVVHRDVKPSNILLSGGIGLLSDFGIARAYDASTLGRLTSSGTAIGTIAYMSPEQLSGDSKVDGRSDQYSLACVAYEMLAGEPPFTGGDARILAARHLTQPPAPISGLRRVPAAVDVAIGRALAKNPADRFPTIDAFVAALEADVSPSVNPPRRPPYTRIAAGVALAVAAAAVGYSFLRPGPSTPLSTNRITVFPLADLANGGSDPAAGERAAAYLGYVLEGTDPLEWEDGGTWLDLRERDDPGGVPIDRKIEISRERGSARFLDGDILADGDSVTVVLRLYDVDSRALLDRRGTAGPAGASVSVLAARSATALLEGLLGSRPVDVAALRDRSAAAVAHFHQGETAFREMRMSDALEHYEAAVEEDPAFALAGLKGALVASWLNRDPAAETLIERAGANEALLPRRYALLARGVEHFLRGAADSAVAQIRAATRVSPDWPEAWVALGDVYFHLMPDAYPLDSLATSAYRTAVRLDPEFMVPLVPLADYGLWARDIESARALFDEIEARSPRDAATAAGRLLLACIDGGPGSVVWASEIAASPAIVLSVGQTASMRGLSFACAEEATRALLGTAAVTRERWGAFLVLQNLLAAQNRLNDLRTLVRSPAVSGLPAERMLLMDAAAGRIPPEDAAPEAEALGPDLDEITTANLWLVGEFDAQHGNVERLERIVARLDSRASETGAETDRFVHEILEAQLAFARGDVDAAVRRLRALRPQGTKRDLMWGPWNALTLERIRLAEILAQRGSWPEAEQIARELDAHRSAFHALVLPRTLAVLLAAAEAQDRGADAEAIRARLLALGGSGTMPPGGAP